jgi:gas vesicle protein
MRQQPTGGSSFLAFLGGAAVGAVSALLFAPQSGRQTRDQMAGYVNGARQRSHQLQDALHAASEAARQAFLEAMQERLPHEPGAPLRPQAGLDEYPTSS